MKIKIGNKYVGEGERCFIIAEAGVNHNGSLKLAKKLVDVAVEAGADAVKFQTYKTKSLVTGDVEKAKYQGKGKQFDMLKKLELTRNNFVQLKKYCEEKGIIFLTTPHTEDVIMEVNSLCPAFKIGSGDLTNLPLLKKIAKLKKPIILGTGMSNMGEVREALDIIQKEANKEVVMLHCTTTYPCPLKDVNLNAMLTMKEKLNCLVGYSDHTLGIDVPLAANQMGACIIEKHFTLDRSMKGPDHKSSLNPEELSNMVKEIRKNLKIQINPLILGSEEKKPTEREKENLFVSRKSIVSEKQIKEGELFTKENISIKRPGNGLPPSLYETILKKRARKEISEGVLIKKGEIKWD